MTTVDQPSEAPKEAASEANTSSSARVELARSAFYAGVVDPVRGIAQIADHFAGTNLDATVRSAAESVALVPTKNVAFGSTAWYAQQLGGAAGMMLPFKLLHSGTTRWLGAAASETELSRSLLSISSREAGLSATTGLMYGSIFHPSNEANVGTNSFYSDRFKTGLGDAASFGTLGFVNPLLSRGLALLAGAVETSPLVPVLNAPLSALLRSPVLPGVISGIPAGITNAEVGALADGRLTPTGDEVTESVASMMFVGGAFSTAHWMTADRPGTDTTNAGHYADKVRAAATFGLDRANMALQRGVPVERYANYYSVGQPDYAPSVTGLAATLPGYRVQVDKSIMTPHIDHATGRINLPSFAASYRWAMPLADPSAFVHEMAQGPLPDAQNAKILSQSDYLDWRLQREQKARAAERQTLVAMDRPNRAARVELDGDKIMNLPTTGGRTYRDDFIADFNRAQGRTDAPFIEYSGGNQEQLAKRAARLTAAGTILDSEVALNVGQQLLSPKEIESIETLSNLTDGKFNYAAKLQGRSPQTLEMAKIAASAAQRYAEGYETHEWEPESLQAALWLRNSITRLEERSGRPLTAADRQPIWEDAHLMGVMVKSGLTDPKSVDSWASTFYKLQSENQRRLSDASSQEPSVFSISVEGAKRFSQIPGVENVSASALLNIYAKMEGESSKPEEISAALQSAAKAWEVDARLPYGLALQVGERPLKERIAASVALDELQNSEVFKQARDEFDRTHARQLEETSRQARRTRVVANRQRVWNAFSSGRDTAILASGQMDSQFQNLWQAAASRSRTDLVANLHVKSAIGPAVDLLHERALDDDARRQLTAAMQNAQEPFKTLSTVKASAFGPALKFLTHAEVTASGAADQRWLGQGAAGLALTFKGGWLDWLTAQEKRGVNHHDATYWLPIAPAEQLPDLGGFLMRNHKQDPLMLESISNRWWQVPEAMRKGDADTILESWGVGHYEDVRNEEFAAQAKRWLVPKSDYNDLEDWFLDTQKVPVPFPLDTTWSDGNLTGRFLPRSDVRGPFLGKYALCCQHVLNADGASSARYGQEGPRAGFYVVEDKSRNDHVVAIALAWEGANGEVVFDNIEASGLGDKQQAVRRILQNTAHDLLATHAQVTLGTGRSDLDLTGLTPAGTLTVATPEGVYTDAGQQVILAQR